MLKRALNNLLNNHFTRSLGGNLELKNFLFGNERLSLRSHIHQIWRRRLIGQICMPSPTIRSNKFYSNKQPVILISGILTFLGLKKETPEEKESELITLMKRGILLTQREEYVKAEQMLHLALKMAQDLNDAEAVTYIYDLLANLAFEAGHHKKAEKLFVSVMQRLLAKGEPEDSNKIVHMSLKLAKIFERTKDYRKAEQGYNFCIDTLNKKLNDEDEDTLALWGMSMDWYSRFLLAVGRQQEALVKLKKAYEMCVKVNGIENEQSVILLNDLGTVSSSLGDTDSAVAYLEEARDVGNKIPGMKYLASIYINLGQLYLMKGMYKESKLSCDTGMRIARNDEDDPTIKEAKSCLEMISNAFKNANAGLKESKNVLVS